LYIKDIHLRNFKNYEDNYFNFSSQGNLIIGKNGIGKTNLLEALSFFTLGKSILNNHDSQLIKFGRESFFLKSEYAFTETKYKLKPSTFTVYYDKMKKKIIHVNNKPLQKLSDIYQYVQVVYSSPDDIYHIFSLPNKRRYFTDSAISKIYPYYLNIIRRFKETLNQRNSLLKRVFLPEEKEVWDISICREVEKVTEQRLKFFKMYNTYFQEAYKSISPLSEIVSITLKLNDISMKILKENEQKEIKYQTSLFGSHLDDFYISLNGKNALFFASQGQKRCIVIALKIALANIIKDIDKVNPIMIFDDTLAELDENRSSSLLLHLTKEHQVFIATPSIERYRKIDIPLMEL